AQVAEDQVCAVVRSLKRRLGGGRLLAYRSGRRWHDVTAADINDYLREVSGAEFAAKDFRTWHATVLAAVGLAVSEGADTADARSSSSSPPHAGQHRTASARPAPAACRLPSHTGPRRSCTSS